MYDLSDFWDRTKEVNFEVGIRSEATYYAVDKKRPIINRKTNCGNSPEN